MKDIAAVRAYADAFERLRPDSLAEFEGLLAPNVRFVDPFNDVRGREAMMAVLRHMFDNVDLPRFAVLDIALGSEAAYLRWRMTFRWKGKAAPAAIEGMSEIGFDECGLVATHIDHWDAAGQLYEKVPLLGWLLTRLRRRLAATVPVLPAPGS
jgi:hypothetical protein